MVALPCFNFNAEATPHMETSKNHPMNHLMDNIQPPTRKCISTMNVHSQDSHFNSQDTNHMTTIPMAHKEVYLLPRPLKAMAHRYRHTEKEAHLLSGPSELQPPEASDQKLRSSEVQLIRSPTHVQPSRQEYSQLTENPKAKFILHIFLMEKETM